jgi:hypothetical protein
MALSIKTQPAGKPNRAVIVLDKYKVSYARDAFIMTDSANLNEYA